jgi:ABC-type uncharacterized transport system auxiliary subunit
VSESRRRSLAGPRGRLTAVAGILVALLQVGCAQLLGGKAELPQRRYYTISLEPIRGLLKESERPYPLQVQVRTFEVLRAYNRNEIIFRRDRYELKRDGLHGWAVRPGDLFTDVVLQYLRQASLFTVVGGDREFLERRPDLILSGRVKVLERYDSGDLWAARLAISLELTREADGTVVWRGEFDRERDVFNPEMTYTVAALSEILRGQMEQYLREIDYLLLNQKRQREGKPLVAAGTDTTVAAPAVGDTVPTVPTTGDYELIPGKLAP